MLDSTNKTESLIASWCVRRHQLLEGFLQCEPLQVAFEERCGFSWTRYSSAASQMCGSVSLIILSGPYDSQGHHNKGRTLTEREKKRKREKERERERGNWSDGRKMSASPSSQSISRSTAPQRQAVITHSQALPIDGARPIYIIVYKDGFKLGMRGVSNWSGDPMSHWALLVGEDVFDLVKDQGLTSCRLRKWCDLRERYEQKACGGYTTEQPKHVKTLGRLL